MKIRIELDLHEIALELCHAYVDWRRHLSTGASPAIFRYEGAVEMVDAVIWPGIPRGHARTSPVHRAVQEAFGPFGGLRSEKDTHEHIRRVYAPALTAMLDGIVEQSRKDGQC